MPPPASPNSDPRPSLRSAADPRRARGSGGWDGDRRASTSSLVAGVSSPAFIYRLPTCIFLYPAVAAIAQTGLGGSSPSSSGHSYSDDSGAQMQEAAQTRPNAK
ncbi:hypothetical protein ACP70R_037013 [Stipagrostis hirtigluma subsp. patula]